MISRAANSPRSERSRGFSLLELLITLFVIALITSLSGLAFNSGGQDMRLESRLRSLADVSSYALEEAEASGLDMGFYIERTYDQGRPVFRYEWLQRRTEGWRPPNRDPELYAAQQLPDSVEALLVLDDQILDSLEADPEDPDKRPQVLLYASGETIPGYLDVTDVQSGDLLWRVEWDLLGRFELLRRGEAIEDDEER